MATKRKPTKSKKRSYTTKTQKQEKARRDSIRDEIILIVTFILSILLLLSNFNLSGKVGQAINKLTFGLFGLLGYLIPIILFCIVVFLVANRGNKVAYGKTLSFIVLMTALSAFIQLLSLNKTLETIGQYYEASSANKGGGGAIGGSLINLIHPLFGTIGSYVIIIGIIMISLLFLTGKTLLSHLAKKSKKSINEFREEQLARTDRNAEEKESASNKTSSKTSDTRTPRTFLIKDKIKNFTSKKNENSNNIKQVNQESFSQENGQNQNETSQGLANKAKARRDLASTSKGVHENQGQQVFSMEEIKPDGIDAFDIPIHRAESYEDDIFEAQNQNEKQSDTDKDLVNNNLTNSDGKSANDIRTSDVTQNSSKGKVSQNGKSNNENLEELKLDQSIDEKKEYIFPSVNLLAKPQRKTKHVSDSTLKQTAIKLQETLESFGVGVTINNVSCGPTVTRYELQPEQGVKVSKITSLSDDIKLNLAVSDIRIEAPIPGKAAVGIEVPNKENSVVAFREIIESSDFKNNKSKLAFVAGKDIGGKNIIGDIGKMPHLLIAGATGSGKSVCINSIIMSILYNAKPSEVRLIMIDPKVVELSTYNGIPHLLLPVVTDPKKAASALNWGVNEMTDRYKKFADLGVRDLEGYNEKVENDSFVEDLETDIKHEKLSQIVIIVDELADLMMVASSEVEDAIARLAQMARAAGIHLIIATQRPSVNVITGVIKANIPSRIAFAVSSAVDSRTILDGSGAEKLLGKGDMLYYPSGYSKPLRVQGSFITEKEVTRVVDFVTKNNGEASYDKEVEKEKVSTQSDIASVKEDYLERDEYFVEAGKFIIEKEKASIGMLQRVFRIGFNRAARIMDQLHHAGVVGPEEGTKPRTIIMTAEEFEQYLAENEIW